MKKNNKESPRGSSIVTPLQREIPVYPKTETGAFFIKEGSLKFWNLIALIIERDERKKNESKRAS